MMIGIPSSGKSYIREAIAQREDATIFSSDIVREKLKMDPSSDEENIRLFDIMYDMIRDELARGNDVLLDSTNTYRRYRMPFLQGLSKDTEVIGIIMMRQIENCIRFNRTRENRIEDRIIRMMYDEYDVPLYEEGFNRFEIIYPDKDESFLEGIEEDKRNIMAYRSMFLNNGMSAEEKLKEAQRMAQSDLSIKESLKRSSTQ